MIAKNKKILTISKYTRGYFDDIDFFIDENLNY
jgi:hypothetical protein